MRVIRDDSTNDEVMDVLLGAICRHVVAIFGRYETLDESGNATGDSKAYSYTGTILSFEDNWFIGTSGHVITSLRNAIEHQSIRINSSYLLDHFGSDATRQRGIEFNAFDRPMLWVDRGNTLGVDFALIQLSAEDIGRLKENGITALREQEWAFSSDMTFLAFGLVGLPDEFTAMMPRTDGQKVAMLAPSYVPIEKLDDDVSKTVRQFHAKIITKGKQDSIRGMSGGPVVGFYEVENETRYKLIALQSHWLKSTGVIWATYVQDAIIMLGTQLENAGDQTSQTEQSSSEPVEE